MKAVGRNDITPPPAPVYECPKCGYNTAGPYRYTRIAPPFAPTT